MAFNPNKAPNFGSQGDASTDNGTTMAQAILNAANDYTGASANNSLVHTAGANGSYVGSLTMKPIGGNVASVMRVYINNGGVNTVAANNVFIGEVSLPVTVATAVQAFQELNFPMNRPIPPGFRIFVGLGTAVAAGWVTSTDAVQY